MSHRIIAATDPKEHIHASNIRIPLIHDTRWLRHGDACTWRAGNHLALSQPYSGPTHGKVETAAPSSAHQNAPSPGRPDIGRQHTPEPEETMASLFFGKFG